MNEVLHKHLVIRSHNSPMSWEQLFAVVWRMSWGCEETGRVQAASSTHKTQWPWGAGSCVCTKNSHPYVHEKRAQKPDFFTEITFHMNEDSENWTVSASSVPAHYLSPELVVAQPGPLPQYWCCGWWHRDPGTTAGSCRAKVLDWDITASWETHAHFGQGVTRGF